MALCHWEKFFLFICNLLLPFPGKTHKEDAQARRSPSCLGLRAKIPRSPSPTLEAIMVASTDLPFQVRPETWNCGRILSAHEHVLLPVSPFNSKFSVSYIEKLIYWAKDSFKRFDFIMPNEQAAVLLEATGNSPGVAAKKTRHELARNFRSIQQAMVNTGTSEQEARIYRFSDFGNNKLYMSIKNLAKHVFDANEKFRNSCLDMSRQAIYSRLKLIKGRKVSLSAKQLSIAVQYIFSEIPFFINSADLFGVTSSVLAYHRRWPVGEVLFGNITQLKVSYKQGFIQLLEKSKNEEIHNLTECILL